MKLNQSEIPARWARAGKLAARALLRAEAEALHLLRAALRAATDRALASLAILRMGDSRRDVAEHAIGILRRHLGALTGGLRDAIARGRLGGKRASLQRFDAEWLQVRQEVRRAGLSDPGPVHIQAHLTANDNAGADASAASLASIWMASAAASAWAWADAEENEGGTVAGAVSTATASLDGRIRRVAATETARAFADAREEATAQVAERHQEARWFSAVFKRWDATNDRRLCPVCSALDNTVQALGLSFPLEKEPGYEHPHCRCVPVLLFMPVRIETEDTAEKKAA